MCSDRTERNFPTGGNPIPWGNSADSVQDLANRMFDHFVDAAAAANLDTTIAAVFLVAELLAALEVHAGVQPEDLVAQFRHLVDQRSVKILAEKMNAPDVCRFTHGPNLGDLDGVQALN